MKKYKLIIYDEDIAYMRGLVFYINSDHESPYLAEGYSTEESLQQCVKHKSFEILLITPKLFKKQYDFHTKAFIILLTDKDLEEGLQEYEWIYKYQSALKIHQEILKKHLDKIDNKKIINHNTIASKVITFASPIGKSFKTTLLLELAKQFGQYKKTLYVNLELISDVGKRLNNCSEIGMTEIIYYLKQNSEIKYNKIQGFIERGIVFDYIQGVKYYVDLFDVTNEEWKGFLEHLKEYSQYEIILIDISHLFNHVSAILQESDYIITTYVDELNDIYKIGKFEEMLNSVDHDNLSEKLTKVCVKECYREQVCEFAQELREKFLLL